MAENPLDIKLEVKRLKEIQKKMDQIAKDLSGDPMKGAMAKATLIVTRSARKNVPVDTGPLRASIVPDIVVRDRQVVGIVGSNKVYAPYQEFGTRPFRPPWRVLYAWALRKTQGNRAEARTLAARAVIAIMRRGIKAKRYLQRALEENADRVFRIIGDAVGRIVRK